MAYAQTNLAARPEAWSVGHIKQQIIQATVASGDTSATVTADGLTTLAAVIVCGGVGLTAQPTISGNTATLAFADPVATRAFHIICLGT
jgi:hypothetical protein